MYVCVCKCLIKLILIKIACINVLRQLPYHHLNQLPRLNLNTPCLTILLHKALQSCEKPKPIKPHHHACIVVRMYLFEQLYLYIYIYGLQWNFKVIMNTNISIYKFQWKEKIWIIKLLWLIFWVNCIHLSIIIYIYWKL